MKATSIQKSQANKIISFQIESRHWPADLGPINPETFHRCGMTCAVIYDLASGQITLYSEKDLAKLGKALLAAEKVLGYNCLGFDRHLLEGLNLEVSQVKWVDLMLQARKAGQRHLSLSESLKNLGIELGPPLDLEDHRRMIVEHDLLPIIQKCVNDAMNLGKLFLSQYN